jgi:hypothetical protein
LNRQDPVDPVVRCFHQRRLGLEGLLSRQGPLYQQPLSLQLCR